MDVSFWGVRGSFPCPGHDNLRYGGNTNCVLALCDDHPVIFDSGTGIRPLGDWLLSERHQRADVLCSHAHLDHILGFPFFAPVYQDNFSLNVHCGNLLPEHTIREILSAQMSPPTFPITLKQLKANINFIDFQAGQEFVIGDNINVKTQALPHPDRATAYRLTFRGRSICYVTDTEHKINDMNLNLVEFIHDADLLIYDCTYNDENFPAHIGWGHSTWQEGVRLAQAANTKQLAIYHHDPSSKDSMLDDIQKQASKQWSGAFVAREGQSLKL